MTDVSARALGLIEAATVWDAHAGFAYERADDLAELSRWRDAGIDYVSVNIGYDRQPWTTAIEAASAYGRWLRDHTDKFIHARSINDIVLARETGRIAVGFDIEGANALNGDPGMVDVYHRLGVRQLLFAYNRNNLAAGGCHDADPGLTEFGREVLAEMNRVGMIVDSSHCGPRTARELIEQSASPAVFSHSNARALCDHERNVEDDLIKLCAARGGVIGVTGVGLFLGRNGADVEHVIEHIDHMAGLVGARHVGLGIDSVLARHERQEIFAGVTGALEQYYWPRRQYPAEHPVRFLPPEAMPRIVEGLIGRGYADADIASIVGGNFLKLATSVWKPATTA